MSGAPTTADLYKGLELIAEIEGWPGQMRNVAHYIVRHCTWATGVYRLSMARTGAKGANLGLRQTRRWISRLKASQLGGYIFRERRKMGPRPWEHQINVDLLRKYAHMSEEEAKRRSVAQLKANVDRQQPAAEELAHLSGAARARAERAAGDKIAVAMVDALELGADWAITLRRPARRLVKAAGLDQAPELEARARLVVVAARDCANAAILRHSGTRRRRGDAAIVRVGGVAFNVSRLLSQATWGGAVELAEAHAHGRCSCGAQPAAPDRLLPDLDEDDPPPPWLRPHLDRARAQVLEGRDPGWVCQEAISEAWDALPASMRANMIAQSRVDLARHFEKLPGIQAPSSLQDITEHARSHNVGRWMRRGLFV